MRLLGSRHLPCPPDARLRDFLSMLVDSTCDWLSLESSCSLHLLRVDLRETCGFPPQRHDCRIVRECLRSVEDRCDRVSYANALRESVPGINDQFFGPGRSSSIGCPLTSFCLCSHFDDDLNDPQDLEWYLAQKGIVTTEMEEDPRNSSSRSILHRNVTRDRNDSDCESD